MTLTPRQQEVVAAARTLLTEEGLEALSLGGVARRLGIRTPSLYKHFGSRRELEAVLMAEGLEAWATALEGAGATLQDVATTYRRWALEHREVYRLLTERPLPRDLLPPGLEDRAAAPLLGALPDRDLARAAWACVHGLVALELAGRVPADADLDAAWSRAVAAFEAAAS